MDQQFIYSESRHYEYLMLSMDDNTRICDHLLHHEHKHTSIYDFLCNRPISIDEDLVLSMDGTIYDHLLHHEHKHASINDFLCNRPHLSLFWNEQERFTFSEHKHWPDSIAHNILSESEHSQLALRELNTYKHLPDNIAHIILSESEHSQLALQESNTYEHLPDINIVRIFSATYLAPNTYERAPDVNIARILSEAKRFVPKELDTYEHVPDINILSGAKHSPKEPDTDEHVADVNNAHIWSEARCSELTSTATTTSGMYFIGNTIMIRNRQQHHNSLLYISTYFFPHHS